MLTFEHTNALDYMNVLYSIHKEEKAVFCIYLLM